MKERKKEEFPGRGAGHRGPAIMAGAVLACLVMFFSLACNASDIPNLNAKELKELLASGEDILVVDTRSESEYTGGHIPRAILISQEKASIADRFLPENRDKGAAIVFYCRGGG